MRPEREANREAPEEAETPSGADAIPGSSGVLQAAWERSGGAMRAALQAWQESCASLLAALGRGDSSEVAAREEACVDRQEALQVATAREALARDRYLAALLHPRPELPDGF